MSFRQSLGFVLSQRWLLEKIPLFLLSVVFGVVSLVSRQVSLNTKSDFVLYYSFFERLALNCYSFCFYIFKGVLPFQLHNFYEFPLKSANQSLPLVYWICFGICFFGAFFALVVRRTRLSRWSREAVFGAHFFAISVGPILSFVNFSPTLVAERYDYLALIGLSIFVLSLRESTSNFKKGFNFSFAYLFYSYAALTLLQCCVWESEESLWKNAIQYSKSSYAFVRYANVLRAKGDLRGAIDYLNEAVKLNPSDPEIYVDRGFLVMDLGDFEYAKKDFTRVIDASKMRSGLLARAYLGRSQALMHLNDEVHAKSDADQAMRLDSRLVVPVSDDRELNLKPASLNGISQVQENVLSVARAAFKQREFQKVIQQCEAYFSIQGRSSEARLLLGQALAEMKQHERAIDVFTQGIEHDRPSGAEFYYSRALSWIHLNQKLKACSDLNQALAQDFAPAKKLRISLCKS